MTMGFFTLILGYEIWGGREKTTELSQVKYQQSMLM
jgi:hypothetical protein